MRLRSKENAMKKLFSWLAVAACVAFAGATLAQDKPAAEAKKDEAKPAASAPAADAKKDAAPAPAAASAAPAAAATPAPVPNKGDVAWMLVCTALVLMMSVP